MRALFVLAAVLIALSPASAFAHNGIDHETPAQGLRAEGSVAAAERHAWSPVCPPGSGHVCGCGNLSLSDGSGKPAVLARCSVSFVLPLAAAAALPQAAPAQPAPQFAPNSPRAPPALS